MGNIAFRDQIQPSKPLNLALRTTGTSKIEGPQRQWLCWGVPLSGLPEVAICLGLAPSLNISF